MYLYCIYTVYSFPYIVLRVYVGSSVDEQSYFRRVATVRSCHKGSRTILLSEINIDTKYSHPYTYSVDWRGLQKLLLTLFLTSVSAPRSRRISAALRWPSSTAKWSAVTLTYQRHKYKSRIKLNSTDNKRNKYNEDKILFQNDIFTTFYS